MTFKCVGNTIIKKETSFCAGFIINYDEVNLNNFHHFPNKITVTNTAQSPPTTTCQKIPL